MVHVYVHVHIGGICFQTFYFRNILSIDEIHILDVVTLFQVTFSLQQHRYVVILTMLYYPSMFFHQFQIRISLHANIDLCYLVEQMLSNQCSLFFFFFSCENFCFFFMNYVF